MNGVAASSAHSANGPHLDGGGGGGGGGDSSNSNSNNSSSNAAHNDRVDPQILRALEVVHDPRSKNDLRKEASTYLEGLKSQDDAPLVGYNLASSKQQGPVVRHYGLSLIEAAIRHRWVDYDEEQRRTVREWVVKLAQDATRGEPLFVRNKIAQLWVEVAKRSWVLDWMDLDAQLVDLWAGELVKKMLVLEVLETLSENSFGKEDTITALRGNELSKACVDIFTPAQVMAEQFPNRDSNPDVRCGVEGWLWRLGVALSWCNEQQTKTDDIHLCAVKILSTLKSVVPWAILSALKETRTVSFVSQSLTYSHRPVQLLAIETLYSLYSSVSFLDEDVADLVGPMFQTDMLLVLKQLYEWTTSSADEIDDEQYLLCKKLAETLHNIGKFYRERPHAIPQDADIAGFLNLLLQILQNESLHVSIPILHYWALLLNSQSGRSNEVISLIGPLLEVCSQRLIRYELLPEDSTYPAILFLKEDVDTMPERHAFLGNYARFGKDIVEQIVGLRPYEALSHILNQAEPILKDPYEGDTPFNANAFKKASLPALKVDARCTVIEAALLGYVRWRSKQLKIAKEGDPQLAQAEMINDSLEKWGLQLLALWFDDPSIQQRISGLIVDFAIGPLKNNVEFVRQVFNYVLRTKLQIAQIHRDEKQALYNDALKELQKFCSQQLQRISLRAADYLLTGFSEINESVQQYTQSPSAEEEDKDRCIAVLFVITQRAAALDDEDRDKRLASFVEPCLAKWQDARLVESLQDFSGFCKLLGLSGFEQYFLRRKAHQIEDWTKIPLDEEGRKLKDQVDAARHELPLRVTKTFLSASLDRSEPGTRHYAAAERLWSRHVTVMLPSLLHLIGLSHLFSDPSSWEHGSADLQESLRRILKDRFWQVGISSGSRDDFYTKVEQTKQTLEGLASAIRGSLRFVRETSDRLVATLSLLGDGFYSLDDLPMPLARALFERSVALSTHQTGMLIETARPIIDNCPHDRRAAFLTVLLTEMFRSLDKKVHTEWLRIDEYNRAASEKDDLVEEMKDESILRQLTFNCVTVVARLFDPNDLGTLLARRHTDVAAPMRPFVLQTPEVFKSIILFCTHALEMHDSRACSLITRVLRTIIAEFTSTSPVATEIREFMSTEVFKACITSLHDPYFVDVQSDLATLIASILVHYATLTDTPRRILVSLPGMTEHTVALALQRLFKADARHGGKQQRAVVLQLLEGLRGVSVSEQGRFPKPDQKKPRSALHEAYMTVEPPPKGDRDKSPDLGGVADMFA